MRHLDTQEDILGHNCSEPKNEIRLSLPKEDVDYIVAVFTESGLLLGNRICELARVYELVREGKAE